MESQSLSVVSEAFVTPRTVHREILQARTLEWAAFLFSRGSSQPRDWTQVSCVAGRFFTSWANQGSPWSGKAGSYDMCIFNILKSFLNNSYSFPPVGRLPQPSPKTSAGERHLRAFALLRPRAPVCAVPWILWLPPGDTSWSPTSGGKHNSGLATSPGALHSYQHTLSLSVRGLFACPGAPTWGAASASARSGDGNRGRQTPSFVLPLSHSNF